MGWTGTKPQDSGRPIPTRPINSVRRNKPVTDKLRIILNAATTAGRFIVYRWAGRQSTLSDAGNTSSPLAVLNSIRVEVRGYGSRLTKQMVTILIYKEFLTGVSHKQGCRHLGNGLFLWSRQWIEKRHKSKAGAASDSTTAFSPSPLRQYRPRPDDPAREAHRGTSLRRMG